MAVEAKGGRCQVCGYNKYSGALDFHHIDETTKEFHLAKSGLTRSWRKIEKEIDKCILVCSNCHREIHAGLINLSSYTGI